MPYLYSELLISANTTYYHDHRTSVIYSHCVFICFTVSLILFLFPPVWIGSTSTEINHADFILAQAPERLKMPWAGSCRQAVTCWKRNPTFHLKSASCLHGSEERLWMQKAQTKKANENSKYIFPLSLLLLWRQLGKHLIIFLVFEVRYYWMAGKWLQVMLHSLIPTTAWCAETFYLWARPKPTPLLNHTSDVFYSQQRNRYLQLPQTTSGEVQVGC